MISIKGTAIVQALKKWFDFKVPRALGWDEWDDWHKETKAARPIAYFFCEAAPSFINKTTRKMAKPFSDVRIWISNVAYGTHMMRARTLERGKWHEFGDRMLHANFGAFVDFIEIEMAGHHLACSKDAREEFQGPQWFHKPILFLLGVPQWRSEESAASFMKWEMSLDDPDAEGEGHPPQARAAREHMILYTWWKHVRPARKDSWEVSGFKKFHEEMDAKYGEDSTLRLFSKRKTLNAAERQEYDRLNALSSKIEESYAKEDDDMLIRLMKTKDSLWT